MQSRKFISPHTEELKKKQKKAKKIKRIIIVFIFCLFLVGLYFLSYWKEINIEKVLVEGNIVLDSQKLEEFAEERIQGKYIYLFPKKNFVLSPRSKIKKELTQNFRRIETLNFDNSNPKILKIKITERKPVYTWCGEVPPNPRAEKESCDFMDKEGYAFDQAPYFSGDIYFKFYGPLEDYYFTKNNFSNLVVFVENLKLINVTPTALFAKGDGEIEVFLSSNQEYANAPKIIFNLKDDYLKLFQNLKSAIEIDPLKTDFKDKYSSLKYLDLRFINKVYYKFNEE